MIGTLLDPFTTVGPLTFLSNPNWSIGVWLVMMRSRAVIDGGPLRGAVSGATAQPTAVLDGWAHPAKQPSRKCGRSSL
jgi:hypothetical protein